MLLSVSVSWARTSDALSPATAAAAATKVGEPAAGDDSERHVAARLDELDHVSVAGLCDLLTIDLDDDIPGPHAGPVAGTTILHSLHSRGLVSAECQTVAGLILVNY